MFSSQRFFLCHHLAHAVVHLSPVKHPPKLTQRSFFFFPCVTPCVSSFPFLHHESFYVNYSNGLVNCFSGTTTFATSCQKMTSLFPPYKCNSFLSCLLFSSPFVRWRCFSFLRVVMRWLEYSFSPLPSEQGGAFLYGKDWALLPLWSVRFPSLLVRHLRQWLSYNNF